MNLHALIIFHHLIGDAVGHHTIYRQVGTHAAANFGTADIVEFRIQQMYICGREGVYGRIFFADRRQWNNGKGYPP